MDGDDEVSAQMIDEIYANGGDIDSQQPHRPIIINGEQLDVEAYAALYTGRTKIRRLMFIADHCDNNVAMQLEALRMAYDEVKKGENTQLFREVVNKIDGRLGQGYGPDPGWSEAVERRAEQRKEKLENELNAYRVWFSIFFFHRFNLFSVVPFSVDKSDEPTNTQSAKIY